ncbi:uncharacterized protein BJ212DRAFT_1304134 [Suillus subaureus]|uniref:Uncharacterized protein n=1 Tax=Suillus subaureus TaxID=48587 RepID=A0A9P7J6G5_9AGAM|nr:uncharacterized protein BJ212DRAFT_1304134 [Suillus subaureus]KAG1805170.1 hypothetical protein BJ212DRAFT_1304134 [Suillus subaureus]
MWKICLTNPMTCTKQTCKKSTGGTAKRITIDFVPLLDFSSIGIDSLIDLSFDASIRVDLNSDLVMEETVLDEETGGDKVDETDGMDDGMVAGEAQSSHNEHKTLVQKKHALPTLNNLPVLPTFLPIRGALEVSLQSQISSTPVVLIHLTLINFETSSGPFDLMYHFLSPYFPCGGIAFHKLIFDVSSKSKSDQYQVKFLGIILMPWQPLIRAAKDSYLWFLSCGALVNNEESFLSLQMAVLHHHITATICFNAIHFQPTFAAPLLLSFAELVLTECLPIHEVFLDMLMQSYKLGRHTDVFLLMTNAGHALDITRFAWTHYSPQAVKCMVKKIHKAILEAQKELEDEDVPQLPTSLKKEIKQYCSQIITYKEEAKVREATSHPREASFYKKSLTKWDVTQRLFKEEIDKFDKAEQRRKGVQQSIKYRTGHAREWFDNMSPSQQEEVKLAMTKWNREEAPEESKAISSLSHKKKASQTLSVSLHETDPQNVKKRFSVSSNGIKEWTATGFESFAEWSKTEFYPSDDQDLEGSDNEDAGNEAAIPEIILDEDGYAKLPSHDGLGLKGQHELMRGIFHASYKVCTGGSRPVPWGVMTAASSNYLEHGSVPTAFVVKDPSHMKTEEVNRLWNHWEQNSAANKKLVIFVKAKDGDVHANVRNEERKKKSKVKRVSLLDSDEEDRDWLPSLNSSDLTERRTQPANTTPDDISITDQYTFLESLSKNDNYLELIDAIRDLAILAKQKPTSVQNPDLPIWANWSWGGSYLPKDMHVSYDTLKVSLDKLQACPISGAASAMPVILGIGLLYRESKHVIEYEEDEADPNMPFYLPYSAFDLEFLVSLDQVVSQVKCTVVEHIEKLTKEALGEDNNMEDEDEVGNKVTEEEVDLTKEKEKQQEQEQQEQEEQEKEQEQKQKGRKRRMPQASTSKSKNPRIEPEVCRSARTRQPSKRNQN